MTKRKTDPKVVDKIIQVVIADIKQKAEVSITDAVDYVLNGYASGLDSVPACLVYDNAVTKEILRRLRNKPQTKKKAK